MHSITVLIGAFGSADKMLGEKNDPQNFRAMRLLVKEVLRSVIMTELDKRASSAEQRKCGEIVWSNP